MPLPIASALKVVKILDSAASYDVFNGAECPLCGRLKVPVRSNPGDGLRYHQCPDCGLCFKSVQHDYQKPKNTPKKKR